jgi:hypothetical protein
MYIVVMVDGRIEGQERTQSEYLVSCPFMGTGTNSLQFVNRLLYNGLNGKRYVEIVQFGVKGVFFPKEAKTMEIEALPYRGGVSLQ